MAEDEKKKESMDAPTSVQPQPQGNIRDPMETTSFVGRPPNRAERRRAEREKEKMAKKTKGNHESMVDPISDEESEVKLGPAGTAEGGDVAIHALELTPEVQNSSDEQANPTQTMMLFARALGITRYGVPAIGIETRVVKRVTPHDTPNVFGGVPLRIRVKVAGAGEFEVAMFGRATSTMLSIAAKTLFIGIARLVANSELARKARVAREGSATEKKDESETEEERLKRLSIPVFRVACVVCRHPVAFRRYVLAVDAPAAASEGVARVVVGAFTGSTFLLEAFDRTDRAFDTEERRVLPKPDVVAAEISSSSSSSATDARPPVEVERKTVDGTTVAVIAGIPVFDDELSLVVATLMSMTGMLVKK